MAISTSTVQSTPDTAPASVSGANDNGASLLSMLVLSVYAAQKSNRQFRKLRRRFLWTAAKLRIKSMFSKKRISDRTLIYILLGIVALVLVFYYPVIALILVLVVLLLILAGVI